MNFFKSQKGAALVLLLAVAFGLLFGSYRSATAEKRKVDQLFQTELRDVFYTRLDAAINMASIAKRYNIEHAESTSATLLDMRSNMSEATENGVQEVRLAYYFSQPIYQNGMTLHDKLLACVDITEADAQYVRGLAQELDSWSFVISQEQKFTSAAAYFDQTVYNPLTKLFVEPYLIHNYRIV